MMIIINNVILIILLFILVGAFNKFADELSEYIGYKYELKHTSNYFHVQKYKIQYLVKSLATFIGIILLIIIGILFKFNTI